MAPINTIPMTRNPNGVWENPQAGQTQVVPQGQNPLGSLAGLVAANQVANHLPSLFTSGVPSAPVGVGANLAPAAQGAGAGLQDLTPSAPGSWLPDTGVGAGVTSGLQGLGVGAETAGMIGNNFLPGLGAAYGGYQIGKNLLSGRKMGTTQGALTGAGTGASIGTMILPGVGTGIGAGVGALAGGILGQFGHGKNFYDNESRNQAVNDIFKGNPQVQLNDGKTYDFSNNKETRNYQIDHANDPAANAATSYFKPLALMFSHGDKKMTDDLTGILYNTLSDGGKITDPNELRQAALRAYSHFGLTPSQVLDNLKNINGQSKEFVTDADIPLLSSAVNSLRHGGKALPFGAGMAAPPIGAGQPAGGQAPSGNPAPQLPAAPVPPIVSNLPKPMAPMGTGQAAIGTYSPGTGYNMNQAIQGLIHSKMAPGTGALGGMTNVR